MCAPVSGLALHSAHRVISQLGMTTADACAASTSPADAGPSYEADIHRPSAQWRGRFRQEPALPSSGAASYGEHFCTTYCYDMDRTLDKLTQLEVHWEVQASLGKKCFSTCKSCSHE
jgi:hypothetical protein